MKNAKDKFAKLGLALLDDPVPEPAKKAADEADAQKNVKTDSHKAVKTASRQTPKQPRSMRIAAPLPRAASQVQNEQGSEPDEEPRRQMTVKLPLSLYAKLSDEKSRRVVANNKHWSIQDIITEALERHLRSN